MKHRPPDYACKHIVDDWNLCRRLATCVSPKVFLSSGKCRQLTPAESELYCQARRLMAFFRRRRCAWRVSWTKHDLESTAQKRSSSNILDHAFSLFLLHQTQGRTHPPQTCQHISNETFASLAATRRIAEQVQAACCVNDASAPWYQSLKHF